MFLEKNEEALYLGASANSCYVQLSSVSQLYFHLPNQGAGHVRAEIRRSSDLISGVVSDQISKRITGEIRFPGQITRSGGLQHLIRDRAGIR